jgi:hypothetical protein
MLFQNEIELHIAIHEVKLMAESKDPKCVPMNMYMYLWTDRNMYQMSVKNAWHLMDKFTKGGR